MAFARRFEEGVRGSADASAMADGVAYRADPEMRRFVEKVLVPNGIYYLGDESFAVARARLTREEMRRQVERNAEAIAQPGPAASAMAKVFLQDPLRLHEFLIERMTAGRGSFRTWRGGETFISPDGRSLLIRVTGRRPPSDLEFSRAFTDAVRAVAERANGDGLTVSLGGSYAIAATSARAIRGDMVSSIVSSIVSLLVLFIIASRRPLRTFGLAFLPVALGVLLGFGVYAAFWPTLTPLTGAVGAILAGLGIDYSILYMTHYQGRRGAGLEPGVAAEETATRLGPALFAAWVTSVLGFIAVGGSRVGALRDFSLMGSLGLAGSFLAAVIVLPALLVVLDRRRDPSSRAKAGVGPRLEFRPLAEWLARRSGWALGASALVLVGAVGVVTLLPGEVLPLESDLTVMHPRPNPALRTQAEIARRFGSSPGSLIVHLKAETPGELVALSHRVRERLSTGAARDGGVVGTLGLATLLPDPAVAARRRAEVVPGEPARVAADFRAVIADSPFDAGKYEPYANFLEAMLTPQSPPTLADLVPYRPLARMMLPSDSFKGEGSAAAATEAITLVFLDGTADDRATRDAAVGAARGALAGLPGATLTGMTVLSHDTEAEVRRSLPRLFALSATMVGAYLVLHFRSARDAGMALLPAAFSFACLLAVMRLAGQKLNLMNLVALPLLIGIDADYGIFLVSLARSARSGERSGRGSGRGAGRAAARERLLSELGTGCYAVVMCAATTVLGFGALVTTSVPAVRSLGVVVGVGVLGCLFATLFARAPLLLRREAVRNADESTAGAPASAPGVA